MDKINTCNASKHGISISQFKSQWLLTSLITLEIMVLITGFALLWFDFKLAWIFLLAGVIMLGLSFLGWYRLAFWRLML